MTGYVDTSVILRVLLRQGGALESWGRWSAVYASEMLKVEARRVIDRLRLGGLLDDEGVAQAHEELARIEAAVHFVRLSQPILDRASGPMPTVLRTLDALHVASALLLREGRERELVFATHEDQQSRAARALGFKVVG